MNQHRITVKMTNGVSYRVIQEDAELFTNVEDPETIQVPALFYGMRLLYGNVHTGADVLLYGDDVDTVIGTPL